MCVYMCVCVCACEAELECVGVCVCVCVCLVCAESTREIQMGKHEMHTDYARERVHVRVCMHAGVCVKERIDLRL